MLAIDDIRYALMLLESGDARVSGRVRQNRDLNVATRHPTSDGRISPDNIYEVGCSFTRTDYVVDEHHPITSRGARFVDARDDRGKHLAVCERCPGSSSRRSPRYQPRVWARQAVEDPSALADRNIGHLVVSAPTALVSRIAQLGVRQLPRRCVISSNSGAAKSRSRNEYQALNQSGGRRPVAWFELLKPRECLF